MLGDRALDAVSICAPTAVHHPATLAAAAAGVHVLCEKPIALDLEQADAMIAACRQAGRRADGQPPAAVPRRRDPRAPHARRGRPRHDQPRAPAAGPRLGRGARGRSPRSPPGRSPAAGRCSTTAATSWTSPASSAATWPRCSRGWRTASSTSRSRTPPTSRSPSRAAPSAPSRWRGPSTGWEEGWWIYGSEGAFEYSNRTGEPLLRHVHRTSPGTTWGDTDVTEHRFAGISPHARHVRAFVDAVRGEREVACTGEDGREAVRLVLASYESAERGQPVSRPGLRPL
jgi:hypothetical protein